MLIEQTRIISEAMLCELFSIKWYRISNFAVYCDLLISEIKRYNLKDDAKDSLCVLLTNSVYL